jgi:oxygen-independent coproporphyrinogen-3 oxidase
VFFNKPPALPAHDACADMQVAIEGILNEKGLEHYETSAFARPGQRCRHNLNYWEFGDYLGIGAGAHGKLSFPGRITRHEQAKQPNAYLKGDPIREVEIPASQLPFEFMLNALRLVEGFPATLFQERTGLPFAAIASHLKAVEGKGLLERDLHRMRPSAKGRRFLNDLLEQFLP